MMMVNLHAQFSYPNDLLSFQRLISEHPESVDMTKNMEKAYLASLTISLESIMILIVIVSVVEFQFKVLYFKTTGGAAQEYV